MNQLEHCVPVSEHPHEGPGGLALHQPLVGYLVTLGLPHCKQNLEHFHCAPHLVQVRQVLERPTQASEPLPFPFTILK